MVSDLMCLLARAAEGLCASEGLAPQFERSADLPACPSPAPHPQVRPNGAPPRETALKSLGMHLLDVGADGTAGCSMGSVDCGGVDPFLRHDRFRLQVRVRRWVGCLHLGVLLAWSLEEAMEKGTRLTPLPCTPVPCTDSVSLVTLTPRRLPPNRT